MAVSAGPKIVKDGLVLCLDAGNSESYPGTGTTWSDLSDNGNNGALVNSPTYNGDNLGSISFDGSNDYAQLGLATDLIPNTSAITVSTFLRPNTIGSYRKIVTTSNSGTSLNGFYLSQGNTAALGFYFGIVTGTSSTSATSGQYLSTSVFSNITGTYDSSTIKLYLNGVLLKQVNKTGTINRGAVGNTGRISGYANNAEMFNGLISNLQIYSRALSQDEITQNFNALRGRYGI